jgi:hypothetical protein
MNNFRKLKEYDNLGIHDVTILNLMDRDCEFWFDGKIYRPRGTYRGEFDFLLEYYVKGILPRYRIEDNQIIPYLHITLSKESDN